MDSTQPPHQAQPQAAADAIAISGIRGYGYTGFFDAEQTLGQWFEVDLRLRLDLAHCGSSDELTHSLNYAEVVALVKTLLETSRFRTIERLTTVIGEALLALPPVEHVAIRLTKVAAPIPGFDGRIAIEMERSRLEPG